MNDKCKAIHETSLGHIIDIWDVLTSLYKDAKNGSVDELLKKKNKSPMGNFSSIARASSNLTMVFPVLCSRNISIENASMVTKALEKNAVSMLQRLFASWQYADVDSFNDYLKSVHRNIDTRAASLDDILKLQDLVIKTESVNGAETQVIKEDMQNINFVLPDDVNEVSLNMFTVSEAAVGASVDNSVTMNMDGRKVRVGTDGKRKDAVEIFKNKAEFFNKQVPDQEFKKANELMPTSMAVNFYVSTTDNNGNAVLVPYEGALCAVKCKLYPVGSDDIVTHIADKTADKNWLTNFIRASTREISFMKDFVLAVDKAKIDAMSMSDRKRTTDKMWKVLERRATTSRLSRAMRTGNAASVAAITTLVVSQEEVEYLRKYYSIDLESTSVIYNLFSTLNLMCVVIVDESLEVAKFIYDEQDPMWETISFTHLERESSDNTYKKVVNLMTKVSR